MKFSYTLLKKLYSAIESKEKLAGTLTNHVFEVEEITGNTLQVAILPNRYGDAGGHLGLAAEAAAAVGRKFSWPEADFSVEKTDKLSVKVEDRRTCPRYAGVLAEIDKNGESSKEVKAALLECGLKSISAVVDIMNYVMLVTGQPLHAFDYDKIAGGKLVVRETRAGEKMETIDGMKVDLPRGTIVIADAEGPLAIAGVKGGKRAEVKPSTRRIVVEAANFSQERIFKTAREVGIITDASIRFSHTLSPELVGLGMAQAMELLKKVCGAKVVGGADIYSQPEKEKKIIFDIGRYRRFVGEETAAGMVVKNLELLGFKVKEEKGEKLVVTPPRFRTDIIVFEDVAEEVVRMVGLEKLPSRPLLVSVSVPEENKMEKLRREVRRILTGLGLDEIMTSTFTGKGGKGIAELKNPVSEEGRWLRETLAEPVAEVARENLRFFEEAGVFEIGKIFRQAGEKVAEEEEVGIVMAGRKSQRFLELKGVVEELLRKLGITNREMREEEEKMVIKVGKDVVGEIKIKEAAAVLKLEKLLPEFLGEREYEPIIKYPAIMRDISLLVKRGVRVGEILKEMEGVDFKEIKDVDLVDFYEDEALGGGKKSLTFRVELQSEKKSLTDGEADKIIGKIAAVLKNKFKVEVR